MCGKSKSLLLLVTFLLGHTSVLAETRAEENFYEITSFSKAEPFQVQNYTRVSSPLNENLRQGYQFLQRDPNETYQTIFNVLAMNAQSRMAFLGINAGGQHGDGMNLYQYLRSNPLNLRDPSGEVAGVYRWFADTIGAAIVSYAFGMDAIITAMSERGDGAEEDIDRALNALPYMIPAAMGGGAVAGAFSMVGFSRIGNIVGAGITGGIIGEAMGQGFGAGYFQGSATAAALEAVFWGWGKWRDSLVVGGGGSSAGVGLRSLMRILKGRGFLKGLPPIPKSGTWSGNFGDVVFQATVERNGSELFLYNVGLEGNVGLSGYRLLLEEVKTSARAEGFSTLRIWAVRDKDGRIVNEVIDLLK